MPGSILDVFYDWNPRICALLGSPSITKHSVLKIQSYGSMFHSFYYRIVFHCRGTLNLVYPLNSWWALGLFTLFSGEVLGIDLRALYLLGRHCTTWTKLPSLFAFRYFTNKVLCVHVFAWRWPWTVSLLWLLCNGDHRHVPPHRDYWLRWRIPNSLPGLQSNCNPTDPWLPTS
jgi:hypothetical protein